MAQIEFTQQEGQVLVNLLNIAVKAQGLEVAESAVILTRKLQEAFKQKIDSTNKVKSKKE